MEEVEMMNRQIARPRTKSGIAGYGPNMLASMDILTHSEMRPRSV
jgi:hypothetical protein